MPLWNIPRLELQDLGELLAMPILPLHTPVGRLAGLPRHAAGRLPRQKRLALAGIRVVLGAGARDRRGRWHRRGRGRRRVLTAAVARRAPEGAAIHRRVASTRRPIHSIRFPRLASEALATRIRREYPQGKNLSRILRSRLLMSFKIQKGRNNDKKSLQNEWEIQRFSGASEN
jgi:hypothetical protein